LLKARPVGEKWGGTVAKPRRLRRKLPRKSRRAGTGGSSIRTNCQGPALLHDIVLVLSNRERGNITKGGGTKKGEKTIESPSSKILELETGEIGALIFPHANNDRLLRTKKTKMEKEQGKEKEEKNAKGTLGGEG